MSDLGYDAGWDLVGHFERAIENAADEPHLPPAEHALVAAAEFERTWLAAHDREVAVRTLRELHAEMSTGWHVYETRDIGRAFLADSVLERLEDAADAIERGEDV